MSTIRNAVLWGIAFFWTVVMLSIGYSAYVSLANVNAGDQIKAADWNAMAANLSEFATKLSPITASSGKVGIGVATPAATLDVNGDFIRTIPRWQGAIWDDTDNGALAWRSFSFTKKYAATGVRVAWNDNFRVMNNNTACSWEILFNGASCANPWQLRYDKYEGNTSSNRHDPAAVFWTCFGLPAGTVTISTKVSQKASQPGGNCSTGWHEALSSIEAEEVR